jgi:hypothetical protein
MVLKDFFTNFPILSTGIFLIHQYLYRGKFSRALKATLYDIAFYIFMGIFNPVKHIGHNYSR